MAREDPQLKLRLTVEMKDRIAEAAKANNRSVNAEIVARLEESFQPASGLPSKDALILARDMYGITTSLIEMALKYAQHDHAIAAGHIKVMDFYRKAVKRKEVPASEIVATHQQFLDVLDQADHKPSTEKAEALAKRISEAARRISPR